MSWYYRPWFYWSFTAAMLIAGVILTVMLITSDRVTHWYGYVIGPAFLFGGLMQILWYFTLKKMNRKK